MISRRFLAVLIPATLLASVSGCGRSSTPASALRPNAPTAATALKEASGTCATDGDSPLVVDWPSHRRAELEATLRTGGVLLASYDCKSLRIMPDCRANGSYAFQRVTLKEDVVRMNDADAIRARLPLAGAGIAAELEGSLARGSSLDLGLAMGGRWTTSTQSVNAPSLAQQCRSATHFVRSVPVGAFAMSTGSRAKARAVAEVFAAGMRAESESTHTHDVRDGSLDSCRAGAESDRAPASGCSAPLRVELAKIDPRRESRAACEDSEKMDQCSKWGNEVLMVSSDEMDTSEASIAVAKMVDLCKKGKLGGCSYAHIGSEVFERKTGKVLADRDWLRQRSCDLGEKAACLSVAERLEEQGKTKEAFSLVRFACESGDVGCSRLADMVEAGHGDVDPKNKQQWLADLRARACQTSSAECDRYAELHRAGLRARGDFRLMRETVKRCEDTAKSADGAFGCAFAAAAHALGIGVPRDMAKAKQAYAAHCATVARTMRGGTCELPKKWQ